jgi:hypothetical protein
LSTSAPATKEQYPKAAAGQQYYSSTTPVPYYQSAPQQQATTNCFVVCLGVDIGNGGFYLLLLFVDFVFDPSTQFPGTQ